ncbi:BQ2448_1409 [Microbotryum intermedium]|uniref:BQ2448_1409 protein n=1 Tax=Microbotryum intermedium TaxID=269621 RepID=A0A238F9W9_9BASI|nr:BQ2448_1409 [Microbotryum intermedium]
MSQVMDLPHYESHPRVRVAPDAQVGALRECRASGLFAVFFKFVGQLKLVDEVLALANNLIQARPAYQPCQTEIEGRDFVQTEDHILLVINGSVESVLSFEGKTDPVINHLGKNCKADDARFPRAEFRLADNASVNLDVSQPEIPDSSGMLLKALSAGYGLRASAVNELGKTGGDFGLLFCPVVQSLHQMNLDH